MSKKILQNGFFLILFLVTLTTYSQYYRLTDESKISILTCGSGQELYSIYGHTAIRIQDSKNHLDVVVNYGNFDFATSNFYAKFVKGDLKYFGAACSFPEFMNEYIETNREVWEQNLLISVDQKQKLFDELNTSLYSEERFYTYKFIDKNCTTMVLDKINRIFGSEVVYKKTNTIVSYRTILYSYLNNHFFENLGINIIFGAKTDALATKIFLPKELMDNLKNSKFDNKPIVGKTITLNKKNLEDEKTSLWNNLYFFASFFLIILFLNKITIHLSYLFITGFIGIFLLLVGFYSLHHEVTQNYNALLFNPLLILFVYFFLTKKYKIAIQFGYLSLVCLGIYILIIIFKADFVMMLPVIITTGIILVKLISESKKLLTSIK